MTPNRISVPNRVQTFVGLQSAAACREGFTILEVLISAGIMVIGLACVASLLPAAAQRMSQAVSEDRAGTLAANAYADITARRSLGLLSATPPGVISWPSTKFLALGAGADDLQNVALDANGQTLSMLVNANALFPVEAWAIQDALDFDESAGSPINTFDTNKNRKTRADPMCWLATLVPDAPNPTVVAGNVAELSIAVFKKQPSANEIVAGSLSTTGILTIGGSAVDDDTRRQFAKGCGSVLALGSNPEWIRINASWADASDTHLICDKSYSGNVVLFANLLRVEKHRIVLD
jgi:type II secretory pathway pseudopilin PulG